jgi:CRISPR-associated endonuclease/helicase Cas3
MFVRFLFSCLVDADSLDTERHMNGGKAALRRPGPPLTELLVAYREHQERLLTRAASTANAVNQVRREVYEACCSRASLEPEIFRLTVPTGGGKTLSSLGFALEHAAAHAEEPGFRRIIYAIPFTSIVEQTADVFRSVFPEPGVFLLVRQGESDSSPDCGTTL